MTQSLHATDTRAASAALTRPQDQDFDRYLLIDDTDEFVSEVSTILRERNPRGSEVLS